MLWRLKVTGLICLLTTTPTTLVHGWVGPTSSSCRQPLRLQMSSALPDLKGKVIYQRLIYKLSPASDVDLDTGFSVEERVGFRPSIEDDGYMESYGRRTLILRGPPESEGDLFGPELYRQDVHEVSETLDGVGNDVGIQSAAASVLFLASNPDLVEGNVLDLQCDIGIGSLMGVIAAGFIDNDVKEAPSMDDPLLLEKNSSPLPKSMKSITLVDKNEEMVNLAFLNAKYSGLDPAKVAVKEQDWVQRPRSTEQYDLYHVIMANDLYLNFPLSKALARTVAYSLEPQPYSEGQNAPRFLFLYRDDDDESVYLKKLLKDGYAMNLDTGFLKLEKHYLKPAIIAENEAQDDALEKEDVNVAAVKGATYESLMALHNAGYDGANGEYFFPIETGSYEEGRDNLFLEREPRAPW